MPTHNAAQIVPIRLAQRTLQALGSYSLRTKLLLSFLLMTLIAISSVAYLITNTLRATLTQQAHANLRHHAEIQSQAVANLLEHQLELMASFGLSKIIQDAAQEASQRYTGDAASIHQQIRQIDKQWVAAVDSDPLIQQ